jgi:hypothetical protein
MAYFEDLSPYAYFRYPPSDRETKNVGWLEIKHDFRKAAPTAETLDVLWEYCKISVEQTRGIHACELCPSGDSRRAERKGENLTLGSSEIRVFGRDRVVYAAPTLIFHYVSVHHYEPPEEFSRALSDGPRPPSPEYFESLEELQLEWNQTYVLPVKPQRIDSSRSSRDPMARAKQPQSSNDSQDDLSRV